MKLEVNGAYTNDCGSFAREIIGIERGQVSYWDFAALEWRADEFFADVLTRHLPQLGRPPLHR